MAREIGGDVAAGKRRAEKLVMWIADIRHA
jgi:hypothetical protein